MTLIVPEWWLGPLYEVMECDCGDLLIREWDDCDYYCSKCGLAY